MKFTLLKILKVRIRLLEKKLKIFAQLKVSRAKIMQIVRKILELESLIDAMIETVKVKLQQLIKLIKTIPFTANVFYQNNYDINKRNNQKQFKLFESNNYSNNKQLRLF
jgi:hypothetical protein